jgi:hypothetical protein
VSWVLERRTIPLFDLTPDRHLFGLDFDGFVKSANTFKLLRILVRCVGEGVTLLFTLPACQPVPCLGYGRGCRLQRLLGTAQSGQDQGKPIPRGVRRIGADQQAHTPLLLGNR